MYFESIDDIDYLELMALRIEGIKDKPKQPVPDFTEPQFQYLGKATTVKDLALRHYTGLAPNPVSCFKDVTLLKMFKYYMAVGESFSDGLVSMCFFAPMMECFEQLFFVMWKKRDKQKIGVYLDGELIGTLDRSNPAVTAELMKPYLDLDEQSERSLNLFCDDLSDAAGLLVRNTGST